MANVNAWRRIPPMARSHMERVFVYGTLRRGERLSDWLEKGKFLGTCRIPGHLYVVPVEDFPFPAFKEASFRYGWVKGEVYEISKSLLKKLDRVEHVPKLYCRKVYDHCLFGKVNYYSWPHEIPKEWEVILGGDWVEWRKSHEY